MIPAGREASEQRDRRNGLVRTCNDAVTAFPERKNRKGPASTNRVTSDRNPRERSGRFSIRPKVPDACAPTRNEIVRAIRTIGLHLQPAKEVTKE